MRTCTSWSGRSRSAGSTSRATRSHAEVLCRRGAPRAGANGWLIGAGWRSARWPAGDPAPHREALDAACGDRPVLLWAHDHHTAWLSSAALALLPLGTAPVVERDAAGEPTGILRETAAWDAAAAIPPPRERELDEARRARPARGARARRDRHPRLPARARPGRLAAAERRPPPDAARLGLAAGRAARRDRRARTAQRPRRRVAAHRPGQGVRRRHARLAHRLDARAVRRRGARRGAAERRASCATSRARCADAGLELAVHAIGDAANRAVLDALAATRERWAPRGLRPRIEHAQLLHPDDLGALRRARRDRLDAALARALRPPAWPRPPGARAAPAPTRSARWRRAARRCASAPTRRSSRSTRWPASRPPPRATGRPPRRSRSSSRSTASGAAPPTRARPSAASAGCCPATRPTSSCSSATGHLPAGRDRRDRRRRDDGRRPLGARPAALVTGARQLRQPAGARARAPRRDADRARRGQRQQHDQAEQAEREPGRVVQLRQRRVAVLGGPEHGVRDGLEQHEPRQRRADARAELPCGRDGARVAPLAALVVRERRGEQRRAREAHAEARDREADRDRETARDGDRHRQRAGRDDRGADRDDAPQRPVEVRDEAGPDRPGQARGEQRERGPEHRPARSPPAVRA